MRGVRGASERSEEVREGTILYGGEGGQGKTKSIPAPFLPFHVTDSCTDLCVCVCVHSE